MMGEKCIYCNNPLKEYDFYIENSEGKICSSCIIEFGILVCSGMPRQTASVKNLLFEMQHPDSAPSYPLSHPSKEQALLRELETLLP